jgi:photosystem II stability/assembly factor-like uncharacterized protein
LIQFIHHSFFFFIYLIFLLGTWPPNAATPKSPMKGRQQISSRVHLHYNNLHSSLHFDQGRENLDAAGWSAAIFRSNDGYGTWEQVFSNDTFYFNQISCPSEQVCFAAAENDDVGFGFVTLDGGNTWSEVLTEPGVSMMAAVAISETEAYIGGGVIAQTGIEGRLYHTTDGGATFTTEKLPGYYFTSISFPDAQHGFATVMNQESTCNVLLYA